MQEVIPPTIEWAGDRVRLIDQRRLPSELVVVDATCPTGADIPIEQRDADELGEVPAGVAVDNRAFDVTPAALVTAYITEDGVTPRR